MADNVVANAGSGGATFATDDIGGTHYPISKLAFGPLDTATIVSTSNGLPVSVINTSIAVTDNGGSLTVDGTVAATQSGAWTVTQSGTWNVGTVTAVTSITNPVAATQSGTWTVSATQSGTWSSRLQDGSGNAVTSRATGSSRPLEIAVVDASGNQITSFGGSGGTASNFTSTLPSTGTAVGFSDGTNMQAARVFDVDSGAGTQYVQGVNLRIASSGGSVEGGTSSNPIRTDPTGTTTQPVSDGGGSLTVDGTVAATQSGTWNVTNITGTVSLPTGAATAAKQPALGTAGSASTDVITVQGIASGVAQPVSQSGTWTVTANAGTGTLAVSLASQPLPTGASTEATLAKLAVSQSTALGTNTQTMVGGSVTTSAPSYTNGNINPLSLATTGHLRTIDSSSATDGGTQPTNFLGIAGRTGSAMRPIAAEFVALNTYAMAVSISGVNGSLGSKVSSLSVPVVIASDQSVIPVSQDSATLYAGTTALTPKFAVITASSSGDTTVLAAVTSKKIRVIRYSLSANGNVSAYFRSGAGGTAISGVKYMTQYGGAGASPCPQGLFETGSNTALVINLNAAVAVSGELTYVEVS